MISWFWVIEAYQKLGKPLPVNVKMCLEAMEESGSEVRASVTARVP